MRPKRRGIGEEPGASGAPRQRARQGSVGPLGALARQVTPARGLALVALAATITLGASQFSDYHAVQVGAPEYRAVQDLAPAPELDRRTPRSAHGASVLAIAAASLLVTALAIARNRRLARLLFFSGVAVVVISLAVDLHQGLREGLTGVLYQGANGVLLGGFWAQLWSGVTLMVVGPLLAAQARGERRRGRRSRRAERRAGRRVDTAPLAPSTGSSEMEGAAT